MRCPFRVLKEGATYFDTKKPNTDFGIHEKEPSLHILDLALLGGAHENEAAGEIL